MVSHSDETSSVLPDFDHSANKLLPVRLWDVLNSLTSHVRSRLGYAVLSGVKSVVSSFARTLYVLWLQITGLMFAAFTLIGVSSLVRLCRAHAWKGDPHRFWTTICFTTVCFGFTIMSFVKAKRRQTTNPAKP
ncbi:MAG TPA: hypothetical protein VI636_07860 [Candidatus Angelobacter sp.]